MTGLEYVLTAVFASVWLVPLAMALCWERRLRAARRARVAHRLAPSRPSPVPTSTSPESPARAGRR